jgi:fibronectin-binding autotransporter adhesin
MESMIKSQCAHIMHFSVRLFHFLIFVTFFYLYSEISFAGPCTDNIAEITQSCSDLHYSQGDVSIQIDPGATVNRVNSYSSIFSESFVNNLKFNNLGSIISTSNDISNSGAFTFGSASDAAIGIFLQASKASSISSTGSIDLSSGSVVNTGSVGTFGGNSGGNIAVSLITDVNTVTIGGISTALAGNVSNFGTMTFGGSAGAATGFSNFQKGYFDDNNNYIYVPTLVGKLNFTGTLNLKGGNVINNFNDGMYATFFGSGGSVFAINLNSNVGNIINSGTWNLTGGNVENNDNQPGFVFDGRAGAAFGLNLGSNISPSVGSSYNINSFENSGVINLVAGSDLSVSPHNYTAGFTFGVNNNGSINLLLNTGSILSSGIGNSNLYGVYNAYGENTLINVFNNKSVISQVITGNGGYAYGFNNGGTVNSFINSGSINSVVGNNSVVYGLYNGFINGVGGIGNIVNSGTISGTGGSATQIVGIFNGNTIDSIINTGGIIGDVGVGGSFIGIYNQGSIGSLSNLQGADSGYGPLTYGGVLPSSYTTLLNTVGGVGHYGQLTAATIGISGTTLYSVSEAPNGVLTGGWYSNVLSGLTLGGGGNITNLSGVCSGIYVCQWQLVDVGNGNSDLHVLSSVTTGFGGVSISKLGDLTHPAATILPILQGGTLNLDQVDGLYSVNFSFDNSNTNTFDAMGNNSVFSGVFSDLVSGGNLIISNSGSGGSVYLHGSNNISGSLTVNPGAILIIDTGAQLGTGSLYLMGTGSVASQLRVLSSTNIAIPISLTGDPIFDVPVGTITSVSSVIADGSAPGDLVLTGGGTLLLSNTNTYTGTTTIQSGATLSLIGDGSIATSSGVVDAGTFDISGTNTGATIKSLSGNGSVLTASGKVLNVTQAAGTFSGVISGAGGLTLGGGSFYLTGANTYTGTTTIQAASTLTLVTNDLPIQSQLIINNGILNLQAANSIKVLGGFTQTAQANLILPFSQLDSSLFKVGGNAILNGGLILQANSNNFKKGSYAVLSANNLTGQFDNIQTNFSEFTRLSYSTSYDANNVYIVFRPNQVDTQKSVYQMYAALSYLLSDRTQVTSNQLEANCEVFDNNENCFSFNIARYPSQFNSQDKYYATAILARRLSNQTEVGLALSEGIFDNNYMYVANRSHAPFLSVYLNKALSIETGALEINMSGALSGDTIDFNRAIVETSDPGQSSSHITSAAWELAVLFDRPINSKLNIKPYIKFLKTLVRLDSFSEKYSTSVTTPLSYSELNQSMNQLKYGFSVNYNILERLKLDARIGYRNLHHVDSALMTVYGANQNLQSYDFNKYLKSHYIDADMKFYYNFRKNSQVDFGLSKSNTTYQPKSDIVVSLGYVNGF